MAAVGGAASAVVDQAGVLEALVATVDTPLAEAEAEAEAEEAAAVAVEALAKVDPPLVEAEQAAAVAVESDPEITNWVEMPVRVPCAGFWRGLGGGRATRPVPTLEEHGIYTEEDLEKKDPNKLIRRTIATLQAAQDDFFEFQAWVREVYLSNGRVMVPEGVVGPKDELQKALDEDWGDGIPSVDDDDDDDDE